jgi:uncharacterized protein YycO
MSLLLRLTNLYCIKFWNYEDHKNSAILDWAMAQVVESLPSQHKALSSNPSTTKKNSVIFFFQFSLEFYGLILTDDIVILETKKAFSV